ncbi:hypothetical protein G4177_33620 [Corallococcus sp. ZKHCc1 1396]|uniref:Uncharacterized protein n=1 Tax=Corallococcus soli TaxID=2710757 RepID=A0ABR9PYT6_9BACT|nr:hypothetical protein [Corallococcus soli]MBE4753100.1 hypothetical protein [Corallococcus soli]
MDEQEETAPAKEKLEFESLQQARDWLREHKTEVALGTLVVIGSTGFILTIGAAGTLILAPLAL